MSRNKLELPLVRQISSRHEEVLLEVLARVQRLTSGKDSLVDSEDDSRKAANKLGKT